ncbi:hypothetical protein J6590_035889 [Homalodisca vitripennis]|nr:hypothetical protein J6590_035889 [Homalodisca vitripennis]
MPQSSPTLLPHTNHSRTVSTLMTKSDDLVARDSSCEAVPPVPISCLCWKGFLSMLTEDFLQLSRIPRFVIDHTTPYVTTLLLLAVPPVPISCLCWKGFLSMLTEDFLQLSRIPRFVIDHTTPYVTTLLLLLYCEAVPPVPISCLCWKGFLSMLTEDFLQLSRIPRFVIDHTTPYVTTLLLLLY